jgi:hypothetical protein
VSRSGWVTVRKDTVSGGYSSDFVLAVVNVP